MDINWGIFITAIILIIVIYFVTRSESFMGILFPSYGTTNVRSRVDGEIYAIEPYKPPSLRGIPAANMWRHPVHDYRGAGIEGNDVPNKYPHASSNGSKVTVLDYVAPLIAARIQV